MSGLDGLQLDPDGYVDMSQFPDDGTDLAGPELDQLREALHADPVDEPTAEQWDAMFDDVLTADATGPFALDDVEGLTGDLDLDGDDGAFDLATDDGDDLDDPGLDDDLDDTGLDDPSLDDDLDVTADLDDGGLDLAPDDLADDAFAVAEVDDTPADISHDFEDLL